MVAVLFRRLFGAPLPRASARAERLPGFEAAAILASDALASVASATEASLVMPVAIPRYPFDGLLLNQRGFNLCQALLAERNRAFNLVRFFLPA